MICESRSSVFTLKFKSDLFQQMFFGQKRKLYLIIRVKVFNSLSLVLKRAGVGGGA